MENSLKLSSQRRRLKIIKLKILQHQQIPNRNPKEIRDNHHWLPTQEPLLFFMAKST